MDQASSSDVPVSVSPKKRLLYWAAFIFISLLITLAVAEIFVRIFTKPVYPILYSDQKVGTVHKQNIHEYLWNDESSAYQFITTNSLGYIGKREPSDEKFGTRIALVGDSFTEGLQVNTYETFPYILEHALNTSLGSTTPIEIFNYGVGGTATFLQILRYREHIKPYHMDIVGIVFGQNDFEDNMNKIHFDVDTYEHASNRSLGLKHFILRFALPKFLFTKLMQEVWFLKILNTLGLYELNEYTVQRISEGGASLVTDPQYYEYTFKLIRTLKGEVESDGSTFFIFFNTIPPGENTTYTSYLKMKEFVTKEKIPYVETGIHVDAPQKPYTQCPTFKCSGHLNVFGHIVYAQILFEPLRDMICKRVTCKAP